MWARRRRHHALAPLVAAGSLALSAAPAAAGDGGFARRARPAARRGGLARGRGLQQRRACRTSPRSATGSARSRSTYRRGPVDWTRATPVAAGNSPGYVEVADFDRDGNDDLAVTNTIDARVSIRLGKGDGTFKTAPDVELVLQDARLALVVGDFNNDTRDDLAVAVAPIKPPNVVRAPSGHGRRHLHGRQSGGRSGTGHARRRRPELGRERGPALREIRHLPGRRPARERQR